VVFNDLCVLEELFLFVGVCGFSLEEGGGELAENIGVLAHEEACFDVFLLVAGWL
jgi:hypothetical protein